MQASSFESLISELTLYDGYDPAKEHSDMGTSVGNQNMRSHTVAVMMVV